MASYRRPKGLYTRTTGNWFAAARGAAGGITFNTPGTTQWLEWGLFNNATDGSSLWVDFVLPETDQAPGCLMSMLSTTSGIGTLGGAFGPIDPRIGSIPGQMFQFTNTGPRSGGFQILPTFFATNALPNGDSPIAIIPPNYQLQISALSLPTDFLSVAFWYTVLKL